MEMRAQIFLDNPMHRGSKHVLGYTDTVSEFHVKAPRATASERLAKGPNVAARERFEPAILRTKGAESEKNEPTN